MPLVKDEVGLLSITGSLSAVDLEFGVPKEIIASIPDTIIDIVSSEFNYNYNGTQLNGADDIMLYHTNIPKGSKIATIANLNTNDYFEKNNHSYNDDLSNLSGVSLKMGTVNPLSFSGLGQVSATYKIYYRLIEV